MSLRVIVRRRWNGSESIAVNVEDLWDFHFQNDAGGVCRALPRAFLGARLWCDEVDATGLGHFCKEGPPPHEIAVCILPTDNTAQLYEQLRVCAQERLR